MREFPHVDVLVVGGGLGGCAAAIAASETGARVRLVEESSWVGGQATNQATPPDEHPWIEERGSTTLYRRYRRLVREAQALALRVPIEPNPGRAWATSLGHPPVLAHHVLRSMLMEGILAGRIEVHCDVRLAAAQTERDRITGVILESQGDVAFASADWIIDATESGDILPLADVEHVTGSEAQGDTGEAHASVVARPDNMQPITVAAVVSVAGTRQLPLPRPQTYDMWRDDVPRHWPGPRLAWVAPDARTGNSRQFELDFGRGEGVGVDSAPDAIIDLWTYRRLIPAGIAGVEEASSINWPQNDYMGGSLLGADASRHEEAARELTRSLVYWLQNDAPRADGGVGFPELRPRGDLTGTHDGLAMRPYIREGRRIRAEYTIVEQDLSLADRGEHAAVEYPDSIGTAAYRIDLHPSTGGDPFIDIATRPFEIPLRALLPVRVENLLAGAKNIGTTHITNGCYRVHPAEWTIGEAAGRLASYCVAERVTPRQVSATPRLLGGFQSLLERRGFDLHWRELNREQL